METATLMHLAIASLYIAVFGEASLAKFLARQTPAWFREKFAATWLRVAPPSLMWWSIAIAELVVAALFVASVVRGEWRGDSDRPMLELGLIGATGVFAGLTFGLRVAEDFAGAAQAFLYGAASALLWFAQRTLV